MNSKLTKKQQDVICSRMGNVRLKLLYKASIHGFTGAAFHQHCDRKSPTVSVGYNHSGYVFGGYTRRPFSQSGQFVNDDEAFVFSFNGEKLNKYLVDDPSKAVKMTKDCGPNFGDTLILIYKNKSDVYSNAGGYADYFYPKYYTYPAEDMHGNDLKLTDCEVYQVEEYFHFEEPWRTVTWTSEERERLMERIKSYKPPNSSVSKVRVLLVGQVGAGKSSFVNSFKSIFKGRITGQAMTGNCQTSLTKQFRTFTVQPEHEEKPLPLVICDTIGLEPNQGGVHMDDISNIINGHIQDTYQFNPSGPLNPDSHGFLKNPELKDKIHCVIYVADVSKVSIMPQGTLDKLKAIREKVNMHRVPQLLLLTKIDEACPLVKKDVTEVYKSIHLKNLIQEASRRFDVILPFVVPVKNYNKEQELDMNIDILLLKAVDQMLYLMEDYFDEHCDVQKVHHCLL